MKKNLKGHVLNASQVMSFVSRSTVTFGSLPPSLVHRVVLLLAEVGLEIKLRS